MARDLVVLRAKLAMPGGPSALVARERLLERLAPVRPVTLLCAPAGFGKTVLAAEHIRRQEAPFAWLSLDEADNDAARFFAHLAAALQTIAPECGRAITDAAASLRDVDVPALLEPFVNQLHEIEGPFFVGLDDYHSIHEPGVHEAIGFLVEHMPASMHLVITTRQEPPLPLSRWRVRHRLVELGQDDLRFTEAEATSFLTETMRLALTPAQIRTLEERTEGWAGGLQLAALSLSGRADPDAFLESFAGDDRYVMDYLTAEVLAAQPPEVRRFLLRTSVLERMNAELCAAVTGLDDCGALLERLERERVFVIPLDARRGWYRYHHLFRGLLQHQLSASSEVRASESHRAASEHFEREGAIHDAVGHALAAADHERVGTLVERHGWEQIFAGRSKQMVAWLREIPERTIAASPRRLVVAIWAEYARMGRVRARWRERVEGIAADEVRLPLAAIDAFELARDPRRYGEAFEAARRLGEGHADWAPIVAIASRSIRAACAHAIGDAREAEPLYVETLRVGLEHRFATMYFVSATGLGRLRALREGPIEGQRSLEEARRSAEEQGWGALPFVSWLDCALGEQAYERDDLPGAARAFEDAVSRAEHEPPVVRHVALVALARVRWAQGRADEIEGLLALADEEPYTPPLVPVLPELGALRAAVALARGRLDEAGRFLDGLDEEAARQRASDAELLLYARHEIARHRADAAIAALLPRLEDAQRRGRLGTALRARLDLAIARLMAGQHTDALAQLDAVLEEAPKRGYRRMFLDAPAALTALLERRLAAGDEAHRELVAELLEARGARPRASRPDALREPLTPSEGRVLELVVAGLSNKEIGERLFVSPNTVKTHVRRVYGKLGAKSRAQAIRRAHDLGLADL